MGGIIPGCKIFLSGCSLLLSFLLHQGYWEVMSSWVLGEDEFRGTGRQRVQGYWGKMSSVVLGEDEFRGAARR